MLIYQILLRSEFMKKEFNFRSDGLEINGKFYKGQWLSDRWHNGEVTSTLPAPPVEFHVPQKSNFPKNTGLDFVLGTRPNRVGIIFDVVVFDTNHEFYNKALKSWVAYVTNDLTETASNFKDLLTKDDYPEYAKKYVSDLLDNNLRNQAILKSLVA